MMRSLLFAASMLLASSVQMLAQEFETATSAVKNMRVGWNLGNTLDANSGSTTNMWIEKYTQRKTSDYEKAWGQSVTTEALIKMFKDAGFNAIRVPVTWYPHMGVKVNDLNWDLSAWSPTQVDAAWMARVKEIVDYVVKNGMYCIINVHHDTGDATTAWLRASTDNYNNIRTLSKTFGNRLPRSSRTMTSICCSRVIMRYSTITVHGAMPLLLLPGSIMPILRPTPTRRLTNMHSRLSMLFVPRVVITHTAISL